MTKSNASKRPRDILMDKAREYRESNEPGSERLSAQDLKLKRYIEIQAQVKALEAELKIMKEEIKHQGSYSTRNYMATVETTEQTRAPSTKDLLNIYGPSAAEHFKVSTVTRIKVVAKGGA